jgi:broad specificity polyphosphatase/5'/3'-nucleotidase SurE
MNNETIYMITEETYEATVNERVLLYSFIRQLAFQMKRAETMEDFLHLKEAAAIYGQQAEKLFETWDIPGRYMVYGDPGDLDGVKNLELLDYGEDDFGEDVEADEDEEGGSFFEVMEGLIAESKAVTADMEAVLAELDSAFEPFRHKENHE